MAAEEKMRSGPSLAYRSHEVRPSFADFLIDRLDAVGFEESADLPGDGFFLARDSRKGRRPDEPNEKFPDIRVGRKMRPEGVQGDGHEVCLLFL
jgi:hypothetical protein